MVLTNIVCFFDVQDSIKTVDSMDVNMRMVSCDLKELCFVNATYMKKICTKFWFFDRGFHQIPIARSGILKIPSCLRSGLRLPPRASLRPPLRPSGTAYCPRGFSKSPLGSGDLGENPLTKTKILYIYYFSEPKTAILSGFVR